MHAETRTAIKLSTTIGRRPEENLISIPYLAVPYRETRPPECNRVDYTGKPIGQNVQKYRWVHALRPGASKEPIWFARLYAAGLAHAENRIVAHRLAVYMDKIGAGVRLAKIDALQIFAMHRKNYHS